jgi:diguanylate cyclase (GGDEF)-like protein
MLTFRDSVLLFGAVILFCASGGFLVVRFTNKLLRGMGWIGASFACGGFASLLFLMQRLPQFICLGVANAFVLLAFVLLHIAILELVESRSAFPTLGCVLLVILTVINALSFTGYVSAEIRIWTVGLLVAAQVMQSSMRLLHPQEDLRTIRTPATLLGFLLLAFSLINVARAIVIALGISAHARAFYGIEVGTLALYLSIALGIAFSFFWMTTTMLSAGLEQIASTDPLTRLYNRRVFTLWCEKELARSERTGAPFALMMIDIDHFKRINDNYGHVTGDRALCIAVERMQQAIRGIDVLARWGGEEFAVLLPNADAEQAMAVAERVRANVARILMPAHRLAEEFTDPTIRMTVSLGVASYGGPKDTVTAMLRRSDAGLYKSKSDGRNRISVIPIGAPELSLEPVHV